MPMKAPDSAVATSFSRKVGTPEASAAASSSRIAAKPKPSDERSIARAVVSTITQRPSMTRKRSVSHKQTSAAPQFV